MRQAIFAVACFCYTAWVNADQPDLKNLVHNEFSESEQKEFDGLNKQWRNGNIKGSEE